MRSYLHKPTDTCKFQIKKCFVTINENTYKTLQVDTWNRHARNFFFVKNTTDKNKWNNEDVLIKWAAIRYSSVGSLTRLRAGKTKKPKFDSRERQKWFISSRCSRTVLRPTQLPIQLVQDSFVRVEAAEARRQLFTPFFVVAKITNVWNYTGRPPCTFTK